ncbi:MAG: hypothetical protein AAFU57_05465 [Bacteroidota bacterium]
MRAKATSNVLFKLFRKKELFFQLLLAPLLFVQVPLKGQELGDFNLSNNYRFVDQYDTLLVGMLRQNDSLAIFARDLLNKSQQKNDLLYNTIAKQILNSQDSNDQLSKDFQELITSMLKQESGRTETVKLFLKLGRKMYRKRAFSKSLDFYMVSYYLSEKMEDKGLFYLSKHAVGTLKNRIGDFSESYEIHNSNLELIESKILTPYNYKYHLVTLFSLAISCRNLGKLELASKFNRSGKSLALKNKDLEMANLFLQHQAITMVSIDDSKKNLVQALDTLLKATDYFEKEHFNPDLAICYYYLGKINHDLNSKDKAIDYFKRVDSIFQITNDIHPEAIPAYDYLIKNYKETDDSEQQLFYVNQFLVVDSVVKDYKSYLNNKITLEYDIPNLLAEKDLIISKQESNERLYYLIIILLITSVILILVLFSRRQKHLKSQFQIIMTQKQEKVQTTTNFKHSEVPERIIKQILNGLEEFEKKEQFTNRSISLNSLSQDLKTNSSYLSKTINVYKHKTFPTISMT